MLLREYGYLILFVLSVAEGPITTVLGAFLSAQNYFNVFIVYGVVVTGDLAGDLLYYAAGRFGRTHLLERFDRVTGLTPERLAWLENYFERNGAKAIIFAKYTQTGFIALPASGAARMPLPAFLFYNLAGTLPKSLALVLIGYFFGEAYNQIDSYIAKISVLVFLGACLFCAYVFWRTRQEKESRK
ncbi:MAG TPA: DedA family protein [Rhizomicrobium sp.]|jgi:membrane protein DedA with SNARE-associated domain|nr:DedA family protein [Rhizomicrobium sp.]